MDAGPVATSVARCDAAPWLGSQAASSTAASRAAAATPRRVDAWERPMRADFTRSDVAPGRSSTEIDAANETSDAVRRRRRVRGGLRPGLRGLVLAGLREQHAE